MDPIVIIGAGIAGYTLAREFRKLDKNTPLLIITSDDGCSYPKPMLSNALTKGKSADQITMFDADAMANTLAAEIITNSVVSQIDPQQKIITISGSEPLKYDKLVLAVGAAPISIHNNTLKVNSLSGYALFREKLMGAEHVALIGPGLIGCEFANDLTNVGIKVSVIGPDPHPMSNLLPAPIGKELQENLAQVGVNWYLGTTVSEVNRGEDEDFSYELKLQDGEVINADVVVSAIGLKPNVELAQKIGLVTTARGIVTDDKLQTSQKNIYALGDCAEVAGHNLLFIAPIMAAAKALAKTLVGQPTAVIYPAMPIAIKTPSYPLVVASPSREAVGEWRFEASPSGFGIKALFVGADDILLGFVLSGDAVSQKQALTKQLPGLLN